MKHLNRDSGVRYAESLGLAILLLSSAYGRAGEVAAQDQALLESNAESRPPEAVIRKWPKAARLTAAAMIEKYGQPNRCTKGALVWFHNGPWLETVVYEPHFFGKRSKDFIEQTIAYPVPADKIAEMKSFDRRLAVGEFGSRLTARSRSETSNFLLMNVADQIIRGRSDAKSASDFLLMTEDLSKAGMASPYTDHFLFPIRDGVRTDEPNAIDERGMTP